MKHKEHTVSTIKAILDAAILSSQEARRACFKWLSGTRHVAPANDPTFNGTDANRPPKAKRNCVKKSAKPIKRLALFRSICQNVVAGKIGVTARRYWGFWESEPVGPGVKTLTPPHLHK